MYYKAPTSGVEPESVAKTKSVKFRKPLFIFAALADAAAAWGNCHTLFHNTEWHKYYCSYVWVIFTLLTANI